MTKAKIRKCPHGHKSGYSPSGRCRECNRIAAKKAREKRRAARTTWAPHADASEVPAGFNVKGVSTQRRVIDPETGEKVLQWQKTERDPAERYQAILDAFGAVADGIAPLAAVAPPKSNNADLACVYPIGDPHIGMYADARETGDRRFDLATAEDQLTRAADMLVQLAPPAHTAVILPLGDILHTDNSTNRTRRSGHQLDVAGRFHEIAAVAVRTIARVVDRALEKHKRVIVRCEIGNHDDDSALWLALCLRERYRQNKRVEIDTSPAKFWRLRFGRTLIASTHGDTVKRTGPTLAEVMAHDWPDDWAESHHRYWYVGHVHHSSVTERPGCLIETFRTAAPRDAHASGAGYRSGNDMRVDVIHKQFGRVNRHIVGVGQGGQIAA